MDCDLPIVPGRSLGGVELGTQLSETGAPWQPLPADFPWEVCWLEPEAPPSKRLRLMVNGDSSVVAFLDEFDVVRGLYATPNYRGLLGGVIRAGMTGSEILRLRPDWRYRDFLAFIEDPELPGFYLKHQENDLDFDQIDEEPFDFIGIFDPRGPYFV